MHSGVAPGAAKSPATALGAMRGQHVPPMPATAVGKAMGAAAAFTHAAAAADPAWRCRHASCRPSNAGSSAEVWAMATGARPGADPACCSAASGIPCASPTTRAAASTVVTLCEIAGLGPCLERRPRQHALHRRGRARRDEAGVGVRGAPVPAGRGSAVEPMPGGLADAHHRLRRQPNRALFARAARDAVRAGPQPHALQWAIEAARLAYYRAEESEAEKLRLTEALAKRRLRRADAVQGRRHLCLRHPRMRATAAR